jgi:hypothetical protein
MHPKNLANWKGKWLASGITDNTGKFKQFFQTAAHV